jgi:hypothetical protein
VETCQVFSRKHLRQQTLKQPLHLPRGRILPSAPAETRPFDFAQDRFAPPCPQTSSRRIAWKSPVAEIKPSGRSLPEGIHLRVEFGVGEQLDQSFEFGFCVRGDGKAIGDFFAGNPFFQFFDGQPDKGFNAFVYVCCSNRRKFGIK